MRRADGELILLWTLPVVGLIWLSAFRLFPGFVQPMSPAMSAEEVAAFYRDPENLPRIRYSMIVFNWFAVGFIPIPALIVLQIRRMAHRTPIFGSLEAGDHCYDCHRTSRGLAAERELGIVGPQLSELVERPIIDQLGIARHQPLDRPFVVQVTLLALDPRRVPTQGLAPSDRRRRVCSREGSFATMLSICENPVSVARAEGRPLHSLPDGVGGALTRILILVA
jgi:hypothetical protein